MASVEVIENKHIQNKFERNFEVLKNKKGVLEVLKNNKDVLCRKITLLGNCKIDYHCINSSST